MEGAVPAEPCSVECPIRYDLCAGEHPSQRETAKGPFGGNGNEDDP